MDALRKAEEQKRLLSGQGESRAKEHGTTANLDLEPLSPPAVTASEQGVPRDGANLPDLPSRLEDLDDQFLAHAQQPVAKPHTSASTQAASHAESVRRPVEPRAVHVRPDSPKGVDESREAARNLFEAKQPPPKSNKKFALVTGLLSLLAVIGIGAYFWWQLQPKTPPLVAVGPISSPPPVVEPIRSAVPPASTFSPPATTEQPPKPITQQAAPSQDDESEPPVLQKPAKRAPPPVALPPVAAAQESPASIRVGKAPKKIDPALEQAYQAFGRGDWGGARSAWQKTLASDPHNPDALHGLAALALRQGQADEAADYYRRALEADPKDALAFAGLVSLRVPVDALQTESRLKTFLGEQPDSPYLNFALGNLYARGLRWAEAQAAFFKAYAVDPENPDYLFNLAVSLDQLHQPRLALQYYNQALEAAKQQSASFDAAQVKTRVAILQASR